MARILLIGFDDATAGLIGPLVRQENHKCDRLSMDQIGGLPPSADVILASGDHRNCLKLLTTLRAQSCKVPFIVVNRLPETARWLDALEAGATDYWAAPFERIQLRWLLQAALARTSRAAA